MVSDGHSVIVYTLMTSKYLCFVSSVLPSTLLTAQRDKRLRHLSLVLLTVLNSAGPELLNERVPSHLLMDNSCKT